MINPLTQSISSSLYSVPFGGIQQGQNQLAYDNSAIQGQEAKNTNPDFAGTLSSVNSSSPNPAYNFTIPQGVTSGQISQQFDTAYQGATSGYAPFAGDHSKIDQLQALYGTVPSAYDVSGTVSAIDKSRGSNLLVGQQAANTAANKFKDSQQPGQYSGAGASVLRAQSLLPFLQQDNQSAMAEGQYADSAKQAALTTASGIAQSLATLQQNYTESLASYNSQRAQFGLNYAQGQTGAALNASNTNTQAQLSGLTSQAQLAENARQANLQAALQAQSQAQQNNQSKLAAALQVRSQDVSNSGQTMQYLAQLQQLQQSALATEQQQKQQQQQQAPTPVKKPLVGTTYTDGYGNPISSAQLYGA